MEPDRGENLNSEVEDPLPDYHEAKGSLYAVLQYNGYYDQI
jgi:hypothetical protein